MSEIILASQSPRRKKLLGEMGVSFTVLPSHFDEQLDESRDAEVVAKELALGKARDVAREHTDAIVIGSDTIVAVNGRQMEKPLHLENARELLLALAGNESTVSTGVAVVHMAAGIERVDVATTKVFFKRESDEVAELREQYLATGDWHDKAGGYGIQSGASVLIESIEGDYDTVVGLPTRLLAAILNDVGIDANAVVEEAPVPQTNVYR
jgi:septum formation protein